MWGDIYGMSQVTSVNLAAKYKNALRPSEDVHPRWKTVREPGWKAEVSAPWPETSIYAARLLKMRASNKVTGGFVCLLFVCFLLFGGGGDCMNTKIKSFIQFPKPYTQETKHWTRCARL